MKFSQQNPKETSPDVQGTWKGIIYWYLRQNEPLMCILHRQDSEDPPPTAMLRLDWKAMNSKTLEIKMARVMIVNN